MNQQNFQRFADITLLVIVREFLDTEDCHNEFVDRLSEEFAADKLSADERDVFIEEVRDAFAISFKRLQTKLSK